MTTPTLHARSEHRAIRPWVVISIGVVVATICAVLGFGIGAYLMLVRQGVINPGWTEANIIRSQQRGDSIIAALDQYRDTRGVYPESLGEILGESLETIPVPVAGVDDWAYASVDSGRGFVLQFFANTFADPTSWYESQYESWFIQDGELIIRDHDPVNPG